jgi:hypothetical protein
MSYSTVACTHEKLIRERRGENDLNAAYQHNTEYSKDEALDMHENEKTGDIELDKVDVDDFIRDPFHPFDDLPEEKEWVLTFRAMFIGLCCGVLVNASNIYLGLKSGWTFGANLFGVSVQKLTIDIS